MIDPSIIADLIADLPDERIGGLVRMLLHEIESQLEMIRLAPSAALLKIHAHHLSGLAATVGAVDLAAAAADYESAVMDGRRPDVEPLLGLASRSRQLIEQVVPPE